MHQHNPFKFLKYFCYSGPKVNPTQPNLPKAETQPMGQPNLRTTLWLMSAFRRTLKYHLASVSCRNESLRRPETLAICLRAMLIDGTCTGQTTTIAREMMMMTVPLTVPVDLRNLEVLETAVFVSRPLETEILRSWS